MGLKWRQERISLLQNHTTAVTKPYKSSLQNSQLLDLFWKAFSNFETTDLIPLGPMNPSFPSLSH
jgi:hypothetical protein